MLLVLYFVVSFILTLSFAKDVTFESCGGEVLNVNADPCEDPCEVSRNTTLTITTTCLSNVDAEKLTLEVSAMLLGVAVPLPGLKKNACVGKNLTCPITEGEEITYVEKIHLKSFFPKVDTVTRFSLKTKDRQGAVVCCFETPVKVV